MFRYRSGNEYLLCERPEVERVKVISPHLLRVRFVKSTMLGLDSEAKDYRMMFRYVNPFLRNLRVAIFPVELKPRRPRRQIESWIYLHCVVNRSVNRSSERNLTRFVCGRLFDKYSSSLDRSTYRQELRITPFASDI